MGDATIGAKRVLTPAGWTGPSVVDIRAGLIAGVRPTRNHVPDVSVVPGFVDLQVNGVDGDDVATTDSAEGWARLDAALLAQGTTTWCPTVVTSPLDAYGPALDRIAAADHRPVDGPRPTMAGVHLEGPFLGGAPGAHRREHVVPVDLDFISTLPPLVRLMTLAPEIPRAREAIVALGERGIIAALGHSTATYDQALSAVDAGARLATHAFNGMAPLHHREPGLVGVALTDDRLVPSLVADGVHVHPAVIQAVFRARGEAGAILVTDAVAWRAGRLGRAAIELRDGAPRLADGTLAGSALTMPNAVRCAVGAGVDLATAVRAASTTPAHLLGLFDRGQVAPGLRADLVALDDAGEVVQTWVAGDPCHT